MNRAQRLIDTCEASTIKKSCPKCKVGTLMPSVDGTSRACSKCGYERKVFSPSDLGEAAGTYTILFNTAYGEYRAPGPKGTEAQAIYTDDLNDAKNSMISDWARAGITIDPTSIKIKKVEEWPKGMGN